MPRPAMAAGHTSVSGKKGADQRTSSSSPKVMQPTPRASSPARSRAPSASGSAASPASSAGSSTQATT
jgi:hypothetical protein